MCAAAVVVVVVVFVVVVIVVVIVVVVVDKAPDKYVIDFISSVLYHLILVWRWPTPTQDID